jgi:eukaryotic-like serine/threonine-protein kinase
LSERFPIHFGRYLLLERFAVGGMAELFLARDTGARGREEIMVIKRLLPHMASQPQFKDMFLDEAKLTSRLDHPKIAQTRDFGRYRGQLFIAMEFVDGLDGLALLRECAHRKVRLPAEIAVHTAHEILDALDFAHNQVDDSGRPLGVVHRDISPSNVLLSRRGEVKLVDFGIARATERSHSTKDGTLKGKYGYMSPEQVLDDEVDARSDLFSVGILLTELLTGRRLFAAQSELDVLLMVRDARLERLDRFGGHIGLDLDRILRKALRKRPAERFSSAAEFRDVLADWLFMHRHEVTPRLVGEVVDAFYDEAWQRKRGGPPGALWKQQLEGGIPELLAGADAGVYEVEHIDGIPAGRMGVDITDSLPVVSIEDLESAPIHSVRSLEVSGAIEVPDRDGVVRVDLEWGETVEMASAGYPSSGSRGSGSKPGDTVDLSELIDEIDVPAVAPDAAESGAPVPVHDDRAMTFSSIDEAVEALAPAPTQGNRMAVDTTRPERVPRVAQATADAGEPDDVGDFAESPPIAVLYRLAVARASGLLSASVGSIHKEIYFREGIPEFVSSNVPTELFGAYLVAEGVLSPAELSTALAVMPRFQNRLGDTLVSLDLLTPLDVLRHLTRQVRKKLIDVCTWSRGSFAWYAGRENPREAFPLDLSAFEVLGAGALALPEAHITEWLHRVGEIRPRVVVGGRVSPEMFQLGARMRDVCGTLDGTRTLADLRTWFARQREHDRFVRLLYLLVQTGLVVPA